jgi:hypothetical protein
MMLTRPAVFNGAPRLHIFVWWAGTTHLALLRTKKWKSRVARSRWVLGMTAIVLANSTLPVGKSRAMGMWSLAFSQTPAPSDPPMGLVGWNAAELSPLRPRSLV